MNLFSFIKSRLSITDVVQEFVTIKKAGIYWKGQCPFHTEKTASFTISPHKEIFYCFGCHTGGDVITFISKIENCSAIDAAKLLIDRYKIAIPESIITKTDQTHSQDKNHYFELCKLIAQWCHEALTKSATVQTYLESRGITSESISYFSIGYFPGGLSAIKQFLHFMRSYNFLPDDIVQAHFLAQGKMVLYSPFEERIIFPIKDHLGRFCGFGGRVFKAHDDRAKYYNSRENDFFSKGSLLFGLDRAKKAIQQEETAFLVEGYTDCIAMVQHGFINTVATLGTACTLEHLKQITRYANRLIVVYDGDKAGKAAVLRLTQLCWQVNLELAVIELPAHEDPASFLNKGYDLAPLIAHKKDIFDFFIQSHGSHFATMTLSEKLSTAREIVSTIHKVDDPLKRDILLQKAAASLAIPLSSLQAEDRALDMSSKEKLIAPASIPAPDPLKAEESELLDKLEKRIFFVIMNNMQLFNKENEEYLITYLPHPLNALLCQLHEAKKTNPAIDFIQYFDTLDERDQQYVSKLLLEFEESPDSLNFDYLLMHLQKKNWKTIVHTIQKKLAQARTAGDQEAVEKILHDFLQLKKKMLHKNII